MTDADVFDLPCCQCDHPDAWKARMEIVAILRAIRRGEPLPPPPDIEGDLPVNCCQRKPRLVETPP
jgi:hypothetical protein